MIAEVNGQVWADTPGVQAAVTRFHGHHVGFGDFAVSIGSEHVYFFRADGTREGEAIAREHSFSGRPHVVRGDAQAIATMIKGIQDETRD